MIIMSMIGGNETAACVCDFIIKLLKTMSIILKFHFEMKTSNSVK